jgi:DNA (cytosine-5)-methyltransferase 1
VLDAADFGVPQHRRRLFIVGVRGAPFEFPAATHGPRTHRAWQACGPILSRRAPNCDVPNTSPVVYARRPHLRPSPFSGLLFNGSGRPVDLTGPCPTILASSGGNKTHFIDASGEVLQYHRHLRAGGRPWRGTLTDARRLSPSQCAALQTLPGWVFQGPPGTRYRLIGNAVPPRLAQAVARALAGRLAT